MVKKFLLFLLACMGCMQVTSQNLGGGASLGFVMSQVHGDQYGGFNKFGWQLGGYAWYDFNDRWSLQPEILVTNRGSREVTTSYRLSMTYIDVPVLVNFHLLPDKKDRVILQGGPSISYLLDAQYGWSKTYRSDVRDRFTSIDVGGHIGIEYLATPNLSLFGRSGISFIDIRNRTNPLTPGWSSHNYLVFGVRVHKK